MNDIIVITDEKTRLPSDVMHAASCILTPSYNEENVISCYNIHKNKYGEVGVVSADNLLAFLQHPSKFETQLVPKMCND